MVDCPHYLDNQGLCHRCGEFLDPCLWGLYTGETTMQTLTYHKRVPKSVVHPDGGHEYVHHFGTGHQELVFATHERAREFATLNDCTYSGPQGNSRRTP